MKRSTSNKLNMYQSVQTVLNDHQTVWGNTAAFSDSVTGFNDKLNLLRARLLEQAGARQE